MSENVEKSGSGLLLDCGGGMGVNGGVGRAAGERPREEVGACSVLVQAGKEIAVDLL